VSAVAAPRGPVVAFNSPRSGVGRTVLERCRAKAANRDIDEEGVPAFVFGGV